MKICTMTIRNTYHKCFTPVKTWEVKRLFDNMKGHATLCETEKDRLEKSGWFKFEEECKNELHQSN